jgi:hypothetical protein
LTTGSVSHAVQRAPVREHRSAGHALVLLDVPEPKVAKNRLHIDVRVGTGPDAWPRILAKVGDLVAAGGAVRSTFDGHHVVMADPEGNEFCVAA